MRPKHRDLNIEEPRRRDEAAVVAMMQADGWPISGATSPRIYRPLFRDALNQKHLTLLCGTVGSEYVGYVLAVRHPRSYRRAFARRHPLMVAELAARKGLRRWRARRPSSFVEMAPSPRSSPSAPNTLRWSDSAWDIAKIIFVGVVERHRGQGYGKRLYEALFDELRRRGVRRVDARIGRDNLASLELHRASGWLVEPDIAGYFATICLT